MASDSVTINVEDRTSEGAKELSPCGDKAFSGDATAQAIAERYGAECGYVGPGHRRVTWACKRWIQDSTGSVFALIRKFVLPALSGTEDECSTATVAYDAGDAAGAGRGTVAAA